MTRLRNALTWARKNKALVTSLATSLVAVIVAVAPEFPGAATLAVLGAILGV